MDACVAVHVCFGRFAHGEFGNWSGFARGLSIGGQVPGSCRAVGRVRGAVRRSSRGPILSLAARYLDIFARPYLSVRPAVAAYRPGPIYPRP